MRRAARTDANQAAIVSALRSVSVQVEVIKLPLDLLVCHRGETALMEVKTDEGHFTKGQAEFLARWPGKVYIVRSPEDAVAQVLGKEVMA